MRSLERDKKLVLVSQPLPPEPILDSGGNDTGAVASVFDEPVALRLNLKPITDQLERQAYGSDVKNILKSVCTPFDVDGYSFVENSAVWITVEFNGVLRDDGTTTMNNNYTIDQILDTGGQIAVYFKKVVGAVKA